MENRERAAKILLDQLDDIRAGRLKAFPSMVVLAMFDKIAPVSHINRKLACPDCGPRARRSYKKFEKEVAAARRKEKA